MTKAKLILDFFDKLDFNGTLPDGIGIMNPYREHEDIRNICHSFYHKYYNDEMPRKLILGINPGRLGAGSTGLPFTDTKRLNEYCKIPYDKFSSHEPSSVFVYEMINAYGGPEVFYKNFYISSVCPLGFIKMQEDKKAINYNYYDSKELTECVASFMDENIRKQIQISGQNDVCYVLGTGKNYHYLSKINAQNNYFKKIVPLEHPRYVMQYKTKVKQQYIDAYLSAFEV
jgi:hypothetical protein